MTKGPYSEPDVRTSVLLPYPCPRISPPHSWDPSTPSLRVKLDLEFEAGFPEECWDQQSCPLLYRLGETVSCLRESTHWPRLVWSQALSVRK